MLEDEDAIFRVAMTAHELLENAAKYASDGKARLELNVTRATKARSCGCRHQQLDAGAHRQLGACYAEMNAAKDAMAHYFSLMRLNAKAGALSRLGLARVRAEGEMEIEVDVRGERRKGRGVRHRRSSADRRRPRAAAGGNDTDALTSSGARHGCPYVWTRRAVVKRRLSNTNRRLIIGNVLSLAPVAGGPSMRSRFVPLRRARLFRAHSWTFRRSRTPPIRRQTPKKKVAASSPKTSASARRCSGKTR